MNNKVIRFLLVGLLGLAAFGAYNFHQARKASKDTLVTNERPNQSFPGGLPIAHKNTGDNNSYAGHMESASYKSKYMFSGVTFDTAVQEDSISLDSQLYPDMIGKKIPGDFVYKKHRKIDNFDVTLTAKRDNPNHFRVDIRKIDFNPYEDNPLYAGNTYIIIKRKNGEFKFQLPVVDEPSGRLHKKLRSDIERYSNEAGDMVRSLASQMLN